MKERIEQLAAGEVLVKKPELDFSPAYLEGRVEAGTVQNKELEIRVRNRVPFKGFFYSTNERVKIETKQAAMRILLQSFWMAMQVSKRLSTITV